MNFCFHLAFLSFQLLCQHFHFLFGEFLFGENVSEIGIVLTIL